MNRGRLLVAIGALSLAGAATTGVLLHKGTVDAPTAPAAGPYRGSEPPGRIALPLFELPRSGEGGAVRSRQLRGRVVLVTFVDSACRDVCPIIIGTLGRALRRLTPDERRQIVPLAISVHPKVDTPAHVRRFLSQHAALGQLDYLVASVARMQPVWKSFHVLSAAKTGNADLHSADVRIFDRDGIWVANLNAGADLSVPNVLHDLRQALKT